METDTPDVAWRKIRALIIGRAYPEPSKKHIETVCTGAIIEDGELLRLYPISWRYLNANQRYKLWTWATFEIRKSLNDRRKESYRVREESIEILSNVESSAERYSLMQRAVCVDRETLDKQYRKDWVSLGLVEIELLDISARLVPGDVEVKQYTRQDHMFVEVKPLDRVPIQMRLKYRCKNNPSCKGHRSRLIAWEYMEAFRKFRLKYGSDRAAAQKIVDAIQSLFNNPKTTALALVGTHSRHPVWMVGQLYFFDKEQPDLLF